MTADVPISAPILETGTRLGEDGRYRLNHLLGTGGMASVWSAHDQRLGRTVAIKIISDSLALDPEFIDRFEGEAYLVAGMSHPHVVQVFDYGTFGNRPYLVMDHVGGGTLADRIKTDEGQWDPRILACELLDALGYIHSAGILHRDLKPANVLIGTDGHARLTDFGIAQIADVARMTNTGLLMGTAEFVAPELMQGQPPSVRSDLYALGVLFRECAPNSPEIAPLVRALTQADPAQRPASAAEALALLHSAPADPESRTVPMAVTASPRTEPVPVPPVPPVPPMPRARPHLLFPLLAIIAVVIVIGTVLMTRQSGDEGLRTPTESGTVTQQLDRLDVLVDQARR